MRPARNEASASYDAKNIFKGADCVNPEGVVRGWPELCIRERSVATRMGVRPARNEASASYYTAEGHMYIYLYTYIYIYIGVNPCFLFFLSGSPTRRAMHARC